MATFPSRIGLSLVARKARTADAKPASSGAATVPIVRAASTVPSGYRTTHRSVASEEVLGSGSSPVTPIPRVVTKAPFQVLGRRAETLRAEIGRHSRTEVRKPRSG